MAAPLSIVILAAGAGKRMHSGLPKVLQPLAGAPLLAHVLELAAALEPAATYVVYGHGGERVRDYFGQSAAQWCRQAEQRGTGHAVLQALPSIPDTHRVLVLYGDVPLLRVETVRTLIASAGARELALLTTRLADPAGYGRLVRGPRRALRSIVEEQQASARQRRIREINTGVLLAPAALLKEFLPRLKPHAPHGEFYLTDLIQLAVRARRRVVTVEAVDAGEVLGVNDKQQLAAAESEYRRRRAMALMAQGVTLIDPARIDLRGPITVGRDVLLDVNVVIDGPVQLADGVRIGPHCVLSHCSIGEGTLLHAHCVVEHAQIGAACEIGPFSRLRPQARLARGVHLGNFVEVKNSRIGEGSKINHLSYVGDSEVGSGVNVGAGTITCNYDGASKWVTQIGDRAFIGSGSMLVAPVKIGDGATIGAGSTITEDAPAGKLTVARSRQITIDDWQRPVKRPG
jgi:bifunctional UDP-N-acetylglucosamine pyrophosphorylase/glucosamine-1-phosphate N-acetyltransferase